MGRRTEFSPSVKNEIFHRSEGKCEECGVPLKDHEGEYDHTIPDYFRQNDPNVTYTAEDGKRLCNGCHKEKTGSDQGDIAKTRRVKNKHRGTNRKTKNPMSGSKASGIRKKMDGTILIKKNGEWVERE